MRVLRVRGFALLLAGQAVSETGNWIAVIAIWGFASFKFDVGAGDLALLFVVLSIPGALLGPLLGVPIDRLGPRRTLLIANVLGMIDALALSQANSYTMIIVLALPLGLIEAMATASLDAIPPRIVPDTQLVTANALLGGAQDVAIVIGPIAAAAGERAVGAGGRVHRRRRDLPGGRAGRAADPGGAGAARSRCARHVDVARAARRRSRWPDDRPGCGGRCRSPAACTCSGRCSACSNRCTSATCSARPSDTFALLQTVFGIGLVLTGLLLAVVGERIARPRYVAHRDDRLGCDRRAVPRHRVGGGRVRRRVPVGRRHRVLLRARPHAAAALRAGARSTGACCRSTSRSNPRPGS